MITLNNLSLQLIRYLWFFIDFIKSTKHIQALLNLCKNHLHKRSVELNLDLDTRNNLFHLAKEHRITVPLAQHLTEELQDTKDFELFKQYNKHVKFKMLKFTQEIIQLLALFKSQDLFCFCLKGPISAQQIFGDYTAKDSRDIDLLIDVNRFEVCIKALQQKGYQTHFDFITLSKKQKRYFRKSNNQLSFYHPHKKIQVEIHWRLFANQHLFPLENSEILANSTTTTIAREEIAIFSDEHLFLYLCAHGAKHQWSKLYWLLEIAILTKKTTFDWPSLLKVAIRHKVERSVVQAVILTHQFFDVPLPEPIKMYYQKSKIVQKLVDQVKHELYIENISPTKKGIIPYWKSLAYRLKLQKGWCYKFAYFHPISINDFQLIQLPQNLFFLYFWLRPFFWIWRYLIKPNTKHA